MHGTATASTIEEVLSTSDIVFLCIPETGNAGFFDEAKLELMKKDALLVSIAHRGVIVEDALYAVLKQKRIRAAVDQTIGERFSALPVSQYFGMNKMASYCTESEIDLVSTMAVEKLIELLAIREKSGS